jgi:hypothetical protein
LERNQVVGGSKGSVPWRDPEIPLGPVAYSPWKNDRWSVWEKLGEYIGMVLKI